MKIEHVTLDFQGRLNLSESLNRIPSGSGPEDMMTPAHATAFGVAGFLAMIISPG